MAMSWMVHHLDQSLSESTHGIVCKVVHEVRTYVNTLGPHTTIVIRITWLMRSEDVGHPEPCPTTYSITVPEAWFVRSGNSTSSSSHISHLSCQSTTLPAPMRLQSELKQNTDEPRRTQLETPSTNHEHNGIRNTSSTN